MMKFGGTRFWPDKYTSSPNEYHIVTQSHSNQIEVEDTSKYFNKLVRSCNNIGAKCSPLELDKTHVMFINISGQTD